MKITNNQRITASLPTLNYLIEKSKTFLYFLDAKTIILMSHLGRPDGKRNEKYSLKPVSEELSKLIKKQVIFVDDCIGEKVENSISSSKDGISILILKAMLFY